MKEENPYSNEIKVDQPAVIEVVTVDNRYSEAFTLHSYTKYEQVKSQIAPDVTRTVPVAVRCPRCAVETISMIEHGDEQECKGCGLTMAAAGNALICTT